MSYYDLLWEHEDTEVYELGLEVPPWIDADITCGEVAAIAEGGCASGAYMPAVTYHEASSTMERHGDDVLEYLEEIDALTYFSINGKSWSGIACDLLSMAVDYWSSSIADVLEGELRDRIDEEEEEDE